MVVPSYCLGEMVLPPKCLEVNALMAACPGERSLIQGLHELSGFIFLQQNVVATQLAVHVWWTRQPKAPLSVLDGCLGSFCQWSHLHSTSPAIDVHILSTVSTLAAGQC